MRYENWISYRYLIASKGRFLTFLNFISIAGLALGVMALIVVTAVMTGFGNNLREKIIGTTPHIMVEMETGVVDYANVLEKIKNVPGVVGSAAYIQGHIFLENSGQAMGIAIRGVDSSIENKVTKVKEYLKEGRFEDLKDDNVIIGSELARYFGYKLGDRITLISPGSGIAGKGWRYELTISGIFTTGMVDYDMNLVLVSLSKAQEIFDLPVNTVTGIGVKVNDPYQVKLIREKIYGVLGYEYILRTWIDINRNLFDALFLEKWGMFFVLIMMVLVASFNIISTLVVTVSTKVHDIGILQSIGVPSRSIRRIFTQHGLWIGFMGIFFGLLSGFGLCYILKTYVPVPKEIYSIDHVPVAIQPLDVLIIVGSAFIITYLATIYPAAKAASLQPVEALRYE